MPLSDSTLAGRFIVFDGPDGSGKTTQFTRFAGRCRSVGVDPCEVREPGGTAIGERIRDILLDPRFDEMSVRCELMLYMASRAQLVDEVIAPALDAGRLVLADRFISATLAYQGAAGGVDRETILDVGRAAIGRHWPDLVVLFDLDEAVAERRRGGDPDRMERKSAEFHRRVRRGFLEQAEADPDRHLVIDATADEETVWAALLEGIERRLGTVAT